MSEPVTQPVVAVTARPPGLHAPVALGTALVAYSVLGGLWLNRHGHSPEWLVVVREWVNRPLGLGEDFGLLGLSLLLVCAGHLLFARAMSTGLPRFLGRLAWQAGLPLVVAVVLGVLFSLFADPLPLVVDYRENPPALAVLAVVVFAVLCTGSAVLLPRRPVVAVAAQLTVVVVLLVVAGVADLDQLAILTALVALPICGELQLLLRTGLGRFWEVAPLVLVCFVVPAVTEHLFRTAALWWFTVAAVVAFMLVQLAVKGEPHTARPRPVDWLVSRAFPLVLLCGVLAYPLLGLLPLPFNYLVALPVWGLGAELLHRCFGKST
ncbi:hypothetical protein AB0A63_29610 [Lentzea sp. NPDC042327]|uniref:hypothetical protein n=1 Tax=Lentzea sp. NPDC042327 TaxID=3154801 RepID=UPI0033EE20C1